MRLPLFRLRPKTSWNEKSACASVVCGTNQPTKHPSDKCSDVQIFPTGATTAFLVAGEEEGVRVVKRCQDSLLSILAVLVVISHQLVLETLLETHCCGRRPRIPTRAPPVRPPCQHTYRQDHQPYFLPVAISKI